MARKQLHPNNARKLLENQTDVRELASVSEENAESEGEKETVPDSPAQPTQLDREVLKQNWMNASTRLETLSKALDVAKKERSDAVEALFNVLGPKFRHDGKVLTIAKRQGNFFIKGNDDADEIPEL